MSIKLLLLYRSRFPWKHRHSKRKWGWKFHCSRRNTTHLSIGGKSFFDNSCWMYDAFVLLLLINLSDRFQTSPLISASLVSDHPPLHPCFSSSFSVFPSFPAKISENIQISHWIRVHDFTQAKRNPKVWLNGEWIMAKLKQKRSRVSTLQTSSALPRQYRAKSATGKITAACKNSADSKTDASYFILPTRKNLSCAVTWWSPKVRVQL